MTEVEGPPTHVKILIRDTLHRMAWSSWVCPVKLKGQDFGGSKRSRIVTDRSLNPWWQKFGNGDFFGYEVVLIWEGMWVRNNWAANHLPPYHKAYLFPSPLWNVSEVSIWGLSNKDTWLTPGLWGQQRAPQSLQPGSSWCWSSPSQRAAILTAERVPFWVQVSYLHWRRAPRAGILPCIRPTPMQILVLGCYINKIVLI